MVSGIFYVENLEMGNNNNNKFKLEEMNEDEFTITALFSFDLFVKELAKSSGKSIEETRLTAGSPPIPRSSNDLWRSLVCDNEKIGYIWIRLLPKTNEAYGYEIYLNENSRGKGHGKIAITKAIELLKELKVKKLKICVFENNFVARKLYDSLGFQVEKKDEVTNQHHLFLDL